MGGSVNESPWWLRYSAERMCGAICTSSGSTVPDRNGVFGLGGTVPARFGSKPVEIGADLVIFARLVDPAGIRIAALSSAVLAAAGTGWADSAAAEAPTDACLLAVAAKLCDQDG